jgi:ketosteroid isomerase-like protein
MIEPEGVARRALLVLAATGAVISSARAAELPDDLAQALNAYERATLSGDIPALAELVAEDYVLVNSDTTVQDKPSFLSDFAVPGFMVNTYAIEQPFQRIWDNAALTGGLLHLGWTLGGERHSRDLRVAHFWDRSGGRWRLVYSQLTRVP